MKDVFTKEGNEMTLAPQHLYVHIPFCSNKCYYCDFNIFVWQGDEWVDDYLIALAAEIEQRVALEPPIALQTIYIGGGTPSLLNEQQLERLFVMLERYFPQRSATLEFSFEVNPGTLTARKCEVLRRYGVNRLSIGVQAFDDRLLRSIGRQHTVADAQQAIDLARRFGFNNVSIDLMFGLPEQSMTDFIHSLESVHDLHVEHVSAYNLRVEEATLFGLWQRQNRLHLPPEDLEVEMYETMIATLAKYGLQQYEISNFAKAGYESRHNLAYWLNRHYYGIGAGAHGYRAGLRYENIGPLRPYMRAARERLPIAEQHTVTKQQQLEELFFLGLRLNEGVTFTRIEQELQLDPQKIRHIYGDALHTLTAIGLLLVDDERIRLTPKGRLLSNEVFASFLLDTDDSSLTNAE